MMNVLNFIKLLADGSQPSTWSWLIFAAGIGLLAGLMITNRNRWDKEKFVVLEPKEFLDTMRKGTLIDVRKEEIVNEKGKIIGSRHFPGKSGATDSKVRKDIPIFIYDEKGSSSLKGIAAKYIKNGAVIVYALKGGYEAYEEFKSKK